MPRNKSNNKTIKTLNYEFNKNQKEKATTISNGSQSQTKQSLKSLI